MAATVVELLVLVKVDAPPPPDEAGVFTGRCDTEDEELVEEGRERFFSSVARSLFEIPFG